jgi:NAD(P)-dependent dehydrogenase (short-subunit alcohol dehydrogenase family)
MVSVDAAAPELLSAHRGSLTFTAADLRSDEGAARAFDDAERRLGLVDDLVAVAGGSARRYGDGPVDQLTSEALQSTLQLNLATAATSLAQFSARWLRSAPPSGTAHAVLIGSALARHPATPLFVTHAYAAAKAGVEGLARSAAAHYAADRLTVNVVAAGLTRTPMAERAQQDPVIRAYAQRRQPLAPDGFVPPEDVAAACEWLLTADTVTGQVVTVDGGWSLYG